MSDRDVCDCPAPMTIGEAAEHFGISVEALRYYESKGLAHPQRDSSGRRVFDQGTLDALHIIVAMREVGFSIAEIHRLLAAKTDESPAVLIERMHGLLTEYRAVLAERRAAIDSADALMARWLSDLDGASAALREGRPPI